MKHKTIIFGLSVLCAGNMYAQGEFQIVAQTLSDADNQPLAVHPVPSERQLLWNETEFYAFFHYGMNTFTGKEWGKGNEAETLYAPTKMPDPEQWLTACKKAGMKGGIAVVKHHDGFCLWPLLQRTITLRNPRDTALRQTFRNCLRKLHVNWT